ncbi:endonuclease/exonuclease/phosphatase family protein [Saccharicrinis sp. FJH62]|uniref:endonuclease/exonuclease/phosphatase family protein n=1 Tax=Saccharicrinis sp. FJH62 TaxID=3344657 RepID=UPI0035D42ACA
MDRIRIVILGLFISIATLSAQSFNVMTYNIKYDNPGDSLNNWDHRKDMVVGLIRFHKAEIFGIQEGLHHQVEYIVQHLPGFHYEGVGRDDGKQKGEYSAVFYNAERFKRIKGTTFWLSETPDKPSIGWDAALERICSCVYLRDKKSGEKMWVFNAHLDHMGPKARLESLKLIHREIDEMNTENDPVILMGDFNATPVDAPIVFISQHYTDTKMLSKESPYGPDATFNGFFFHKIPKNRIDYIFVNKKVGDVNRYGVLTDSKDCHYPSDHFPVLAEIVLTKK